MSYILCSNIENEDKISKGGFEDPATFTNFFKSPLIIEPNSEIAVESVKLDRQEEWSVQKDDTFFVYWGPEQNDTTSLTSGGSTKNGVRVKIKEGSYTSEGFARALQFALNRAPMSPEVYGGFQVSAKQDATSLKFSGYNFTLNALGDGEDIREDLVETDFREANAGTVRHNANPVTSGTPAFAYDSATQTLSCNVDQDPDAIFFPKNSNAFPNPIDPNRMRSTCAVRLTNKPLSAINGIFEVNVSGATAHDGWCLGLSRPTTPYWRNGFPTIITGRGYGETAGNRNSRSQLCYMDFWIQYNPLEDGKLQVYQWKYNPGFNSWSVVELKYYQAGANSSYNAIIDTAGMANVQRVKWKLEGNELKLYLVAPDSTETYLVDSAQTGQSKRKYNFPPTHNSTETLLPTFQMLDDSQTFVITEYHGRSPTGWKPVSEINTDAPAPRYFPIDDNMIVAGSDWYSNAEVRGGNELRYNQIRPSILFSDDDASTYTYYNPVDSVLSAYNFVIISGPEVRDPALDDFSQYLYVIPLPENEANMSKPLGFGKWSVVEYSVFGDGETTPNVYIIESIEVATYTVHSAFIRINDLPIQTFNGNTSSRSNIVYHIPRFTNDGRQFGELYFQAPEKTYIKLNNTDKIMLSQMKIDVVARNERIVKDLTGATVVMLHIRKSK
jgi:hypothetical protein